MDKWHQSVDADRGERADKRWAKMHDPRQMAQDDNRGPGLKRPDRTLNQRGR